MDLQNKNVLVTGAARRIGRATALAFAERGANVIVHYNQSQSPAEQTRDEIRELGVQSYTTQADLYDADQVKHLLTSAREQLDPIRVLVNNASVFDHVSFGDTGPEHWNHNQQVNLSAPVQLMRQFSRQNNLEEGRIINLLDWRAEQPQSAQFAYSVSKSGLASATKAAAQELGPDITVNGVAPGPILPPDGADEEELAHVIADLPAGRWGDVDDVVQSILFFATSSNFITGDILHVDGGRHLR